MSPHYLVKWTTFSSGWRYGAFFQTLVALKRTGCDVWQMECQASNVIANIKSDHLMHGYMLPVFFATDQLHCPPCSAEIQPMSQQNASGTRPYGGLVLDTHEKMKKIKKLKKVDVFLGTQCSSLKFPNYTALYSTVLHVFRNTVGLHTDAVI